MALTPEQQAQLAALTPEQRDAIRAAYLKEFGVNPTDEQLALAVANPDLLDADGAKPPEPWTELRRNLYDQVAATYGSSVAEKLITELAPQFTLINALPPEQQAAEQARLEQVIESGDYLERALAGDQFERQQLF